MRQQRMLRACLQTWGTESLRAKQSNLCLKKRLLRRGACPERSVAKSKGLLAMTLAPPVFRPTFSFVFLALIILQGCRSDNAEEVSALQQQVAALTHQVEEAHEKIGTLRDTAQETNRFLALLKTEVDRLKAREGPPVTRTEMPREQPSVPATLAPQEAEQMSCAQIWRLLGQGKDGPTVARALNTTPAVVRSCEEQVGRARPQR
jgi:hypothetical protein